MDTKLTFIAMIRDALTSGAVAGSGWLGGWWRSGPRPGGSRRLRCRRRTGRGGRIRRGPAWGGRGALPLQPGGPGPAGGTGTGGDDEPRGGLPLAVPAGQGERVAGGLVAGLADVDLVQRREPLAVVGDGFDHAVPPGGPPARPA